MKTKGKKNKDMAVQRTKTERILVGLLLACLMALLPLSSAMTAPGVSGEKIVFGQSACFSGHNKLLGLRYRQGILAAFAERNRLGGVNGRMLELVSHDDEYEPKKAIANAKRFASENDVLAVIGGVGTPTARQIAPVLLNAGIPFVGHVTGANFLHDSKKFPNVLNLRASYIQEIEVLLDHIVRVKGKRRFGIIYQEDVFGRSVLRDYEKVLKENHDIPILAKTTFSRNTHAVYASFFPMMKADLDSILIVGTSETNYKIINLARDLGYGNIFMANLSFALPHELRKMVNKPKERVLVTEVVPSADDTSRLIVQNYRRALRAGAELQKKKDSVVFETVSLEGYILGRFVISMLERMGDDLTRENFMKQALSAGPIAIDDWLIEFKPGSNSGSSYVRLVNFGSQDSKTERGKP